MVIIVKRSLEQCTCPKCKSLLEYYQAEVKTGMAGSYDGSVEYYDYIICPECKQRVEVK